MVPQSPCPQENDLLFAELVGSYSRLKEVNNRHYRSDCIILILRIQKKWDQAVQDFASTPFLSVYFTETLWRLQRGSWEKRMNIRLHLWRMFKEATH